MNTLYGISAADEIFMQHAYAAAVDAFAEDEVPVGAVLVHEGNIISSGHNRVRTLCDPTAHAEILALRTACNILRSERLQHATLYVTLEPCVMCMGAILHARVSRLVYAVRDPRAGAAGSKLNLCQNLDIYKRVQLDEGALHEPCRLLLKKFFQQKRAKN